MKGCHLVDGCDRVRFLSLSQVLVNAETPASLSLPLSWSPAPSRTALIDSARPSGSNTVAKTAHDQRRLDSGASGPADPQLQSCASDGDRALRAELSAHGHAFDEAQPLSASEPDPGRGAEPRVCEQPPHNSQPLFGEGACGWVQATDDLRPAGPVASVGAFLSKKPLYEPFLRWAALQTRPFYPFSYDWRRDCEGAVGRLLAFLRCVSRLHGGRPVQLVAHGVGGVIAYAAIKRPQDVRDVDVRDVRVQPAAAKTHTIDIATSLLNRDKDSDNHDHDHDQGDTRECAASASVRVAGVTDVIGDISSCTVLGECECECECKVNVNGDPAAVAGHAHELIHSVLFAGVPFRPSAEPLRDLHLGSTLGRNCALLHPTVAATFPACFALFPVGDPHELVPVASAVRDEAGNAVAFDFFSAEDWEREELGVFCPQNLPSAPSPAMRTHLRHALAAAKTFRQRVFQYTCSRGLAMGTGGDPEGAHGSGGSARGGSCSTTTTSTAGSCSVGSGSSCVSKCGGARARVRTGQRLAVPVAVLASDSVPTVVAATRYRSASARAAGSCWDLSDGLSVPGDGKVCLAHAVPHDVSISSHLVRVHTCMLVIPASND